MPFDRTMDIQQPRSAESFQRTAVRMMMLVLALAAGGDSIAGKGNGKGNGNGHGNGHGPALPDMGGLSNPGRASGLQPILVLVPTIPVAPNLPGTQVGIVASTPGATSAASAPSLPGAARPGNSQGSGPALPDSGNGNGNAVAGNLPSAGGGSQSDVGRGNDPVFTTPRGEVMLAPGQSVELVDPATPGLRVQVVAPADRPLEIGSMLGRSGQNGIHAGLTGGRDFRGAERVVLQSDGRIVLATGNHGKGNGHGGNGTSNGNAGGSKAASPQSAQDVDVSSSSSKGNGRSQSEERVASETSAKKSDEVSVTIAQAQDTPVVAEQQRDVATKTTPRSRAEPENTARGGAGRKFGVCS